MATKFTTEKYAAIKLDTSNLAGPVHPVERQHKFTGLEFKSSKKTESKGHQADAQLEVLKYPVMGVEVRKHGFKDTAPASYKIEHLVGPSFDVQHSHHFERDKVLSEKVNTLSGPAFPTLPEHGHKYPHKGKLDIITETSPHEMFGPVLPVEASNKYQGNASIPKVRQNKVMAAPAYRGINIQHSNQYQPDMEPGWKEPPMDTPMAGPKLPNVEESHKYGPVPERRAPMGGVSTPVYGVEGDNKYNIVNPRVKGEIVMAGPKYTEEKSHYHPQSEKVKGELAMCGPVWQCTDSNNKYNPETKRVEGDLALTGPVYRGVDDSSKYPDKGKLEITGQPVPHEMFGPVLPVEASNKYQGPMKEQPKVHPGKMMSAPSYRGIDIQHSNQYQPDMEPGWKENPMDTPMAGPKLPNVEESHKYGPVPTRRAPMHELPTPVYGVQGDNQYSVVNPRVKGQIVMAGPKYVEEKSHYNPQSEKVKGQLAMCGPVWQDVDSSALKYVPETKKVEGLLSMCAPKYRGVDDSSKYNPQTERKEVVKEVFGPVLPVESNNKYQPMETAKVRQNKLMAAPAYRGIDIQHSSSYAPVNPHL